MKPLIHTTSHHIFTQKVVSKLYTRVEHSNDEQASYSPACSFLLNADLHVLFNRPFRSVNDDLLVFLVFCIRFYDVFS
jgi:hypothetical protein